MEWEFTYQWKKLTIVPIYIKGNKTDCSNYIVTLMSSTIYKILSNILLSRLTPYDGKTVGDSQCRFCHNGSTTAQKLPICHILEKKWEFTGIVHQLLTGFRFQESLWLSQKKSTAQHFTEYGIPMKPVRKTEMCLNKTYKIIIIIIVVVVIIIIIIIIIIIK